MDSLLKEAKRAIDTSWFSSWYWDSDHCGHLTLEGWEAALKDANKREGDLMGDLGRVRRVIPKIEAEIKRRESWLIEEPTDD